MHTYTSYKHSYIRYIRNIRTCMIYVCMRVCIDIAHVQYMSTAHHRICLILRTIRNLHFSPRILLCGQGRSIAALGRSMRPAPGYEAPDPMTRSDGLEIKGIQRLRVFRSYGSFIVKYIRYGSSMGMYSKKAHAVAGSTACRDVQLSHETGEGLRLASCSVCGMQEPFEPEQPLSNSCSSKSQFPKRV